MNLTIKKYIKDTALYFYDLSHPEDKILQTLVEPFSIDDIHYPYNYVFEGKEVKHVVYLCYQHVVKNHPNIISDIIPDMSYQDLKLLGLIAVKENNKDVIEYLHKNGLNYKEIRVDRIHDERKCDLITILPYAYEKHGSEIIKFMNSIGVNLDREDDSYCDKIANDIDLLSYLKDNMESVDLFIMCLRFSKDPLLLLNLFEDKVDVRKYGNSILHALSHNTVDVIKSFLEYGIEVDFSSPYIQECVSKSPLVQACRCNNFELVEFYLQYGMHVDKKTLEWLLYNRTCIKNKPMLDLFLKYDVDFSALKDDDVDHEFFAKLEDHGLDKDTLLKKFLRIKKKSKV